MCREIIFFLQPKIMLDYEKQIFLDILQEDGLVIAAKGLGLENVVVNLLKAHSDPGNLVFVLGTEGKHQEWLVSTLSATGTSPAPRIISSEIGVVEREASYLEGGVWFVPTRILVVDLLKKRIPIDLITGFVVWKAHGILQRHQDSFVLRLFRQENKTGFIKAFSNHSPGFTGGLSKVEQMLKALFIRNLFLWPRYHAAIKNSLAICKPKVIELHLDMTPLQLQLQSALLDLIKSTIQEMKRLNPMLDTEEITVENALCDTFHKVLHSQLDPVWHALSERTKLLLADIKLFHYLIRVLITYDSIYFYYLIKGQRSSERVRQGSGWQLMPAAEILFNVSARRVIPTPESQPDAEPSPKWQAVSEVIGEIHRNLRSGKEVFDVVEEQLDNMFELKEEKKKEPNTILILTKDERTCTQLYTYLKIGSEELLNIQYRKLLSRSRFNQGTGTSEAPAENKNTDSEDKEEEFEDDDETGDSFVLTLTQSAFNRLENEEKANLAGCFEESLLLSQTQEILQDETDNSKMPIIVIKAWQKELMELPQYLGEIKPSWVVMYDVDITVVRQLEVYQRYNSTLSLTVYFLIYGGTVEEQAYLTSLRREKQAFDYLIEEKGRLVIPDYKIDCSELDRGISQESEALGSLGDSRKGGLSHQTGNGRGKVIVDMREFRSELPALIHGRGMDIEALTITVGDYILSPDICLERKSVSDLIQSLNSGRLYNQAQALTRHYSRPMLLIEFDKDKPFDLQDRYYLSTDSSSEQLVTKLQLLTLHFPQLRLVWSPSPQATAVLFEELKQGQPDPDPATAIGVGIEETPSDLTFNSTSQSFIQKLPGVTSKNLLVILRKGYSLDILCSMTIEELGDIFENSAEAQSFYDATHKTLEPGEGDPGAKQFRPGVGGVRGRRRKRFH